MSQQNESQYVDIDEYMRNQGLDKLNLSTQFLQKGINHSSVASSEDFHSSGISKTFIASPTAEKRLSKHDPGRLTVIDEVREHTKSDLDLNGGQNYPEAETSLIIPPLRNYHEQDSDDSSADSRTLRSDSNASDGRNYNNLSKFLEHGVDKFNLDDENDDLDMPEPMK